MNVTRANTLTYLMQPATDAIMQGLPGPLSTGYCCSPEMQQTSTMQTASLFRFVPDVYPLIEPGHSAVCGCDGVFSS